MQFKAMPAGVMRGRTRTRLGWGLPPGVRQGDCDGSTMPLADASGSELWAACDPNCRTRLSRCFAEAAVDVLRDLFLDLEGMAGWPEATLGEMLWTSWIRFRDEVLRDLASRGELTTG